MKRPQNWQVWMAQLYILLAFAVLALLVVYCVADYDFVAICGFVKKRFQDRWFLMFIVGGLLSAALFLMMGVRCFVDYIRQRDDFMHSVVHDLRTPVAGLRLMIGRNDRGAAIVAERMRRMIENLSDFINLGGNRAKPKLEVFDIVAAYREAYDLLADDFADLESGPIAVEGGAREIMVHADRTKTVQILWNLIGNELKYAAPQAKVYVAFSVVDDMVSVRFSDEGDGMSRREMKHAFDRYYRAQNVRRSGKGGFGIGLCAAREDARAMGGDLVVGANRPKGCVFTLCLKAG